MANTVKAISKRGLKGFPGIIFIINLLKVIGVTINKVFVSNSSLVKNKRRSNDAGNFRASTSSASDVEGE